MENSLELLVSPTLILALFGILLLLVVVLLILLVINNRKIHDVTYPVYDYIVKGAHKKANEITYDAMKDAREMRAEAELEGIKIVAKEKLDSKRIEGEYEAKLDQLTTDTEKLREKYTKALHDDLERLSSAVEKRVATGISKNESFLQEETTKLSNQLSNTFTTLEANAKEQIRSNVEKEFISVKKIIETYRQERFALIDSQILALIERTASIALNKSLTLKDHTELMYKALEEAKSKDTFG
jgi:DNA anti-recombination protein RmuC